MKKICSLIVICIIIFSILSISSNASGDNWTQYGHDDRNTGCSSSNIPENIEKLWSKSIDGGPLTVIADNDYVYVGTRQYITSIDQNLETELGGEASVFALDLKSGSKKWSKEIYDDVRGLAINENKLIVSSKGYLIALEKSNGDILWYTEIGTDQLPVAINNNTIFQPTYNRHVYAVNIDDGEVLWDFNPNDNFLTSPVVYKGKVIIGCMDGKVYAINEENGEKVWEFKTGDEVVSTPVIFNDKIYIGSNDKHLYVLNPDTGNLTNSYLAEGNVYTPAIGDGKIVFWTKVYVPIPGNPDSTNLISKLLALDIGTLTKSWEFQVDEWINEQPLLATGKVIAAADDYLNILDIENGNMIYRKHLTGEVSTEAAISNEKIVVATFNSLPNLGIIYVFGEGETSLFGDISILYSEIILVIAITILFITLYIIIKKRKGKKKLQYLQKAQTNQENEAPKVNNKM